MHNVLYTQVNIADAIQIVLYALEKFIDLLFLLKDLNAAVHHLSHCLVQTAVKVHCIDSALLIRPQVKRRGVFRQLDGIVTCK